MTEVHAINIGQFLLDHQDLLATLGLKIDGKWLNKQETKAFSDEGISCNVHFTARIKISELVLPEEFTDEEAVRGWFEHVRAALEAEAMVPLADAHSKISMLLAFALNPEHADILGDAESVKQKYLRFPRGAFASELMTLCDQKRHTLQETIKTARLSVVKSRLKSATIKLKDTTLSEKVAWQTTFLATHLELWLVVEHRLTPEEINRLATLNEGDCVNAAKALLNAVQGKLELRVQDQLRTLAARTAKLPHIELLTNQEIADVISPYFGGLSPNLKKSRASNALVAVEERARERKFQSDISRLNDHRDSYANVASYYPLARALKRELILYVGPTNSGKTWRALNDLASHDTGVYLAPLRLLALEGQEELEKRGKETSFITGEERELKPYAHFTSSTIEMLNPEVEVGAVVIDEVQLITDERRGWAWLAALLGAPAKRVIMTGSPDVVKLIEMIASYLGEELSVNHCHRYNELKVADLPTSLHHLAPQTAVVCFSRRDVLRIKEQIQRTTDFKVSVIYGNLSPQVRREEARRFRCGETEILVATDAIAMGLNLPIREVVFFATSKFNGEAVVPLTHSEIRQIGGRAGRYGFAQFGVVHALDQRGVKLIKEAMRTAPDDLEPPFFVAPGANHVHIISEVLKTTSLERILAFFDRAMEFSDPRFTRANIDDLSYLAGYVDEILPFMPVDQRLTIASAPVTLRSDAVLGWFLNAMLPAFSGNREAEKMLDRFFDYVQHFTNQQPGYSTMLRDAEDYLRGLTVYAWLSYRYPEVFTRLEDCEARRDIVNAYIERELHSQSSPTSGKRGGGRQGRGGGDRRGGRRQSR